MEMFLFMVWQLGIHVQLSLIRISQLFPVVHLTKVYQQTYSVGQCKFMCAPVNMKIERTKSIVGSHKVYSKLNKQTAGSILIIIFRTLMHFTFVSSPHPDTAGEYQADKPNCIKRFSKLNDMIQLF